MAILLIMCYMAIGPDSLSSTVIPQTDPYPYLSESITTEAETLKVCDNFFSFTGLKYQYGDTRGDINLGAGNIKAIVRENPQALAKVNTFAKYQVSTFLTSMVSASLLGWGIGSRDETLVLVGLGGFGISFGFNRVGYSHLKKGVAIYNENP